MKPLATYRLVVALLLTGLMPFAARAQNVGIGTPAPTQTLDVNGSLRVRGLSGDGNRMVVVQPDGTLGLNASVYDATVTSDVPAQLGTIATAVGNRVVDLEIFANRAYALTAGVGSAPPSTLECFDVSNPGRPVLLSSVIPLGNVLDMALNATGTRAYVLTGSRIFVYDVGGPTMVQVGGTPPLIGGSMLSIQVRGTTAFVVTTGSTAATRQLRAFDVSDNYTSITPLGAVNLTGPGARIVLSSAGTTAYVTTSTVGPPNTGTIETFDVTNPTAPTALNSAPATYYTYGLALDSNRLYVASLSTSAKLEVFDATSLALLGSITLAGNPTLFQVVARGTLAYVVTSTGFRVINVGNPAAMSEVYTSPVMPGTTGGSIALHNSSLFVLQMGCRSFRWSTSATRPAPCCGAKPI